MSEARVTLPGSDRSPAPRAKILGPADPAEQVVVSVYVRGKDDPLPILSPGHYITNEEYTAAYGASANDFQAVIEFGKEYNLTAQNENASTRSIELRGAIGDLNRAFGVKLTRARIGGKEFRQRDGEISIPQSLLPIVRAVVGLDDRPQGKPHLRKFAPRTVRDALDVQSFTALSLGTLYNFPTGLDGTGQTIAIMEFGGGFLQSDLTSYFQGLGIKMPSIVASPVNGGKNSVSSSSTATDEETEVALDIQVAGALAPGANQVVYFAPSFNPKNLLDTLNAAIGAQPQPVVISMSWGNPESVFTTQFMQQYDSALQHAAQLGIPVTVASGDDGSFDGTGSLSVDFPASAPHSLGCGGTTLAATGNTITSETVWSGSGGGVSQTFPKPTYQSTVNVPPPTGSTGGRGVPDVAGDADPNTGYTIRVKGKSPVIGGTSAVAPLWAALIARFGQSMGKPVGFLNTLIYPSSVNGPGFHDITSGTNDSSQSGGPYSAGPGWDACTGFGSPNGTALLNALKAAASSGTGSTGHPSHPGSGSTGQPSHPGSGSTGAHTAGAPYEYPILPPPVPAPAPALPVVASFLGSNSVALVGVVGLASVVGLVAVTGIVATVALAKEKG
jgi:kumamolisin